MKVIHFLALIGGLSLLYGCDPDSDPVALPDSASGIKEFTMVPVATANASGTATFYKTAKGTKVIVRINSASGGGSLPAHIHKNTAAEGGDIVAELSPVDGSTGISTTDLTSPSYEQLIELAGYVDVHKSASDLNTIVTAGDIGPSALTSTSKTYTLDSLGTAGLKGTATFTKRVDGSALVNIKLDKTKAGDSHPAHIHFNSALEGGSIAISLNPVNGALGFSNTTVKKQDNGSAITYDQLLNFDGYLNVHQSATNLSNVISQKDIGGNEITSTSKSYPLATKAVAGIEGTARFDKRKNGNALVTLTLKNTPVGGEHPAHIHFNSAMEGGGIAISLNPVVGGTGISRTNIRKSDGPTGGAVSYDSLVNFDGYINVHLSPTNLATIVAQGDIGGNELTGNKKTYALQAVAVPGVAGTALFEERRSGSTLVTLKVSGPPSGTYPAHIHANSAAEGGGIVVTFNEVDGNTGMSVTNVEKQDDGKVIKYADLLKFNGYINVHQSMANLGTLIAQGDIGNNELTGNSRTYLLSEKNGLGVFGNAKLEERKDGTTLVTLTLANTVVGSSHPAHIHQNSAAETGPIVISLKDVNGTTGKSLTSVRAFDDKKAVAYAELIQYDGYINVHLSAADLATVVAQGNIGSNIVP